MEARRSLSVAAPSGSSTTTHSRMVRSPIVNGRAVPVSTSAAMSWAGSFRITSWPFLLAKAKTLSAITSEALPNLQLSSAPGTLFANMAASSVRGVSGRREAFDFFDFADALVAVPVSPRKWKVKSPRRSRRPFGCFGSRLLRGFGLLAFIGLRELAAEAFDTAGGVDQLLLAGEERVAGIADFDDDVALVGGARYELVAAGALDV